MMSGGVVWVKSKGLLEFIVIDHLEKAPSEN